MNSLDEIRVKIQKLYQINPKIRINVTLTRPKIDLKNEQVTITGVYPHIFQIEDKTGGITKNYTLQYSDILIGHIEILNLA